MTRLSLSPGAIARVLGCLWIAVDHDPAGKRAAHACAERWRAAGREVYLVRPRAERDDLNDTVKGMTRHAAR